jgi:[acyl-carrier-protein] S-malonyltransferase
VTVAWLFPGQGSHSVGMADAWRERSPLARDALDEAATVLGFDLPALVAEGPQAKLDDTYNQQPALLSTSVAILRAALDEGLLPPPSYVAGHSLGEFGALVAAEALSYAAALSLVRERGRLMGEAGTLAPGRMVAILGLDDALVESTVARFPGAEVANYNAPGQVVISGSAEAVVAAAEALAAAGARRTVPLPITIAAHSALMAPAAQSFTQQLLAAPFTAPKVPVVVNRSSEPLTDVEGLRAALAAQLTAPVLWTQSVERMLADGVRRFYEVGPGGVLTGLVRRIARERGYADAQFISLAEPPADVAP